jgi:hypothetical protein
MLPRNKRVVALYVDKASRRWIVRDPEGNYWSLPSTDHAWDARQPFIPAEETDLEPVPVHFQYLHCLPF